MVEVGDLAQKLFFSGGDGWNPISDVPQLQCIFSIGLTHRKIDTAIIDHFGDLVSAAFERITP